MATSGTINGTVSGNSLIKSRITWKENSYSITDNTSNVTVKLLYSRDDYQTTYGTGSWVLNINGTKYTGSSYKEISYSWVEVFSKTVTITHDSNGSKTFNMNASGSYIPGTSLEGTNCSGNGTLTTIPRASTFNSVTNSVALGGTATIKITAKSSSFYHKATWTCGSASATQNLGKVDTTSQKSYTYTIPTGWSAQMPSSTSKTASVKIQTYSDSSYNTSIGSAITKNFTVTVPNNSTYNPTVSLTTTLGNATRLGSSTYVQGKTKVTLSATGGAKANAKIKSYVFKRASTTLKTVTSTSTSASTSETTNTTGSVTYSVTITDSRGRTATASKTITVNAYSNPTLTINNYYRSDQDGTKNTTSGTYFYIKATFSSTTAGGNSITASTVKYKLPSDSSWRDSANLTSGTGVVLGNGTIDTDKNYDVYVSITDKVGTVVSKKLTIPTIFVTMDFKAGGTGVAIGKIAETDSLFDVAMNMRVVSSTGKGAMIQLLADGYNDREILYSDAGNLGFFDRSSDKWLVRIDQNKNVFIPEGTLNAPKSIVHGDVNITPSAANTPTAKAVTWSAMGGMPSVTATALTTVPGTQVTGVAVVNRSTTGCNIYVTRTDTTAFSVSYIAIY